MSDDVNIPQPDPAKPTPQPSRPHRRSRPLRGAQKRVLTPPGQRAEAKPAASTTYDDPPDDRRTQGDGEDITRVSRSERTTDRFAIPKSWRRAGWDYQFNTIKVYNEPVDSSQIAEAYEGGWRPVLWRDVPQPWQPGAKSGDQVTRYGQALYTRPMHLTEQARSEDFEAAERQKRDRVQGAFEGRVSGQEGLADIKGVRARALGISIEGEVGVQQGRTRTR